MVTKRKSVKNAKKISSAPGAAKAASEAPAKAAAASPVKAAPKSPAKGAEKEPAEAPAKAASADAVRSSAKAASEAPAKGPAKGSAEGAAKAAAAKPKPSVASARKVAVSPAPAAASASTGVRSKKAAKRKASPSQSGRLEKQASAAAGAGEDAETAPSREGAPRKHAGGRRRWPWYVVLGVLAVLLVAAAGFSWDRWLRYDDARELQGEWQVDGTTRVVVVDGASIKLTDDVAYAYTIDPTAKTIEFTFGGMEGSGRYRFSADRSQLVVMEGSSYSALSTLFEDIGWMWDGLVRLVQGQAPVQPEAGEGVTVLARVSHDAAAQPRNDEGLAAGAGNAADSSSGADSNAGASGDAGVTDANAPAGDAGSNGDSGSGANADGGNAGASGNTNGSGSADAPGASGTNASPSGGSGSNSPAPDNLFNLDDVNDAGA